MTVIPADLGSSDAVERLISEVKNRGLKIDCLMNNAGLGVFENFLDTSPAKQMNQVSVNISAVVALSHAFASEMTASHRGGLINIASTAGFQPLAGAAVYAASKAFVLFFSEALSLELEKSRRAGVGRMSRPRGYAVLRRHEAQFRGQANGPTAPGGCGDFAGL